MKLHKLVCTGHNRPLERVVKGEKRCNFNLTTKCCCSFFECCTLIRFVGCLSSTYKMPLQQLVCSGKICRPGTPQLTMLLCVHCILNLQNNVFMYCSEPDIYDVCLSSPEKKPEKILSTCLFLMKPTPIRLWNNFFPGAVKPSHHQLPHIHPNSPDETCTHRTTGLN